MRLHKTTVVNKNPNVPMFVCLGGTAMPHDPDLVTVFLIRCGLHITSIHCTISTKEGKHTVIHIQRFAVCLFSTAYLFSVLSWPKETHQKGCFL